MILLKNLCNHKREKKQVLLILKKVFIHNNKIPIKNKKKKIKNPNLIMI